MDDDFHWIGKWSINRVEEVIDELNDLHPSDRRLNYNTRVREIFYYL